MSSEASSSSSQPEPNLPPAVSLKRKISRCVANPAPSAAMLAVLQWQQSPSDSQAEDFKPPAAKKRKFQRSYASLSVLSTDSTPAPKGQPLRRTYASRDVIGNSPPDEPQGLQGTICSPALPTERALWFYKKMQIRKERAAQLQKALLARVPILFRAALNRIDPRSSFKLPDSLLSRIPSSRMEQLLNSNMPPLEVEERELRDWFYHEGISLSHSQQVKVTEIVSPRRKLSDETILEIFHVVKARYDEGTATGKFASSVSLNAPMWALSRVCSQWRRILDKNAVFWSSVVIPPRFSTQLLDAQVQRVLSVPSLPIHISWELDGGISKYNQRVFERIQSPNMLARIESLYLKIPLMFKGTLDMTLLNTSDTHESPQFTNLSSLTLCVAGTIPDRSQFNLLFRNCPRLQHLALTDWTTLRSMTLPWDQIKTYHGPPAMGVSWPGIERQSFFALGAIPSVERVVLSLRDDITKYPHWQTIAFDSYTKLPTTYIHGLKHLTLRVPGRPTQESLQRMIRFGGFPALEFLEIDDIAAELFFAECRDFQPILKVLRLVYRPSPVRTDYGKVLERAVNLEEVMFVCRDHWKEASRFVFEHLIPAMGKLKMLKRVIVKVAEYQERELFVDVMRSGIQTENAEVSVQWIEWT